MQPDLPEQVNLIYEDYEKMLILESSSLCRMIPDPTGFFSSLDSPIEQVGEKVEQGGGIKILLQTGDKTLRELIDFPNLENDSPEEAARKQAKLLGAPEPESDEPKAAQYEPPAPVDPRFTGRIRPEWKGNGN